MAVTKSGQIFPIEHLYHNITSWMRVPNAIWPGSLCLTQGPMCPIY